MAEAHCDIAIVGGGPAGSTAAAFCAERGLQTIVIEREKFPREKVCGDCLNPQLWPILRQLALAERVCRLPHAAINRVDFVSVDERTVAMDLPGGANGEIAVKRSLFDALLLDRARELGAEIRDRTTLTALRKAGKDWALSTSDGIEIRAKVLVAADGRNSTVARLLDLLPRVAKERIALQAHVPLPDAFGDRVVLQWLAGGYSGQAPVNDRELNLCLVGTAKSIGALQTWASKRFHLPDGHSWRSITPLTRSALSPARENVLLVGDAARVVEPFTGEGIFYAMRSGQLAAVAAERMLGQDPAAAAQEYVTEHAAMYRGRLWINALARLAVLSPRLGSLFFELARFNPALLQLLTSKVVS